MTFAFGERSQRRLDTIDGMLKAVIEKALSYQVMDFTILQGNRPIEEQQRLYAKGRTTEGGIVTYVDGINNKSKHNYLPSLAVDIAPYPSLFESSDEQWGMLAGLVQAAANELKVNIIWGGNFNKLKDKPHFEKGD